MPRRATALLLAVAVAAAAFVLSGHPAEAVAADAPDTAAWVTNGDVHAVVHSNGRTYLGGTFDQVGPNTGFGVGLNPATGALALSGGKVNGHVHAAVPNGAGGWFIAGDFTRVGPVSRHYAAEIRSDGTVGGWNPNPDLPVYALAFDGNSRIYIGGEFTTVRKSSVDGGGEAFSPGLAATKKNDGGIDLSAPMPAITPGRDANDVRLAVKALDLGPDNGRLYVGGSFTALGGVARSGLGAVNLTGPPALAAGWNPQPDGPVAAVTVSGPDRVFIGGAFSNIGGGARSGLAVLATGGTGVLDPTWAITADGAVNAFTLVPGGGRLFVGGAFGTIGGAARRGLAALFTGGAGTVDTGFAADTDADPGSAVLAIGLSPDMSRLYAGGTFGSINGDGSRFLSALNSVTGAVDTSFDPRVAAAVRAVRDVVEPRLCRRRLQQRRRRSPPQRGRPRPRRHARPGLLGRHRRRGQRPPRLRQLALRRRHVPEPASDHRREAPGADQGRRRYRRGRRCLQGQDRRLGLDTRPRRLADLRRRQLLLGDRRLDGRVPPGQGRQRGRRHRRRAGVESQP